MLTSAVSFFQSDIFEQLEHLYIPLFVRLVCILTRCVLYCVPTLCPCNLPLPSLLLCVLAAPRLPLLVSLASYTNLYVPFTRLSSEVLGPLEQEIQGLQAFRQPTQVTTTVPGPGYDVSVSGGAAEGGDHVPGVPGDDARGADHAVRTRVPLPLPPPVPGPQHRVPLLPRSAGVRRPSTSHQVQVCSRNVHIALDVIISINVMLPIQHLSGSRNFFISSNI